MYWEDQRGTRKAWRGAPLAPGVRLLGMFVLLFVFQSYVEQHDHHVQLWCSWGIVMYKTQYRERCLLQL